MTNWFYISNHTPQQIQSISDMPKDCIGFVYMITNLQNNKFYIGRKQLHNTLTKRLGKKEAKLLAETTQGRGRRATKKQIVKESNWQDYYGSSKTLLEDVNKLGKENFKREILLFCYNKKQLTFYEMKYQVIYKCLEKPQYTYNDCILGKFYSKDLIKD